MSDSNRVGFFYGTLIDLGFDPDDPEILLELGLTRPVDWDAVGDDGEVKCRKFDFVLTVDYVKVGGEPLLIHCMYDHVKKDHGLHDDMYVYVLSLRPTRDKEGRDCDRTTLVTAYRESRNLRGRSWCADIGEIRLSWRHDPSNVIRLENGAFEPEAPSEEAPRATDDEVEDLCAQFDAICDELAAAPDPTDDASDGIPAAELETSTPGIPLTEEDIEFILDGPLVVMDVSQDTARLAVTA